MSPRRLFASAVVSLALIAVSTGPAAEAGPIGATNSGRHQIPVIRISQYTYHPQRLTVRPQQPVVVVSFDYILHSIPHTVTSNDGLFSVRPRPLAIFRAPKAVGQYGYHCQIHSWMTGVLIVS